MKRIVTLIFAGIVGGLTTLAGVYFMQGEATQGIAQETVNPTVTNLDYTESRPVVANPIPAEAPTSFRDAANRAMPAVVHISSSFARRGEEETESGNPFLDFFGGDLFGNRRPQGGSGSGVIYSQDGYIVTNNHVIENAAELEVTLYDNRKFKAEVIGTYPKTDLAVIKINANDLPVLRTADSDQAQIGDWVLAVGNPFELRSTVTAGIISAKGRSIRLLGGGDAIESFIQTDAAVNPGNSGGALVSVDGDLLGINTAIATRTGAFQGYSFAVPVNLVKRIADDIIEFGTYQRPFLGVTIFDLDDEVADSLRLDVRQGVVIDQVIQGGSADFSGMQPYDVVVKVDNKRIKNVPELQEAIGSSKVGDTVTLTVLRDRREENIPVILRRRSVEDRN